MESCLIHTIAVQLFKRSNASVKHDHTLFFLNSLHLQCRCHHVWNRCHWLLLKVRRTREKTNFSEMHPSWRDIITLTVAANTQCALKPTTHLQDATDDSNLVIWLESIPFIHQFTVCTLFIITTDVDTAEEVTATTKSPMEEKDGCGEEGRCWRSWRVAMATTCCYHASAKPETTVVFASEILDAVDTI